MKMIVLWFLLLTGIVFLPMCRQQDKQDNQHNAAETDPLVSEESEQQAKPDDTRKVKTLVQEAASLVQSKGEDAFKDFRVKDSKWRQGETYIFVVNPEGNMLVHPDPKLEGKNQLELKSINGKSIIKGILNSVTAHPNKPEGWFHYQWPVPGGITPRWKSTFAQQVKAPSGKSYVIGCGIYSDRMEKEYAVDLVKAAVEEIEKKGEAALPLFRDKTGPFLVKDAYILVITMDGVELVNPAFPSFEGKNVLNQKDAQGKFLIKEMLKTAEEKGSGWVNYVWPKPGESIPTPKTTFVQKAKMGEKWVVVGCGVYTDDPSKAATTAPAMTAQELMQHVREGAALLSKQGEKAYVEFRKKDTKWFHDDTYFFVWTTDGIRVFHPILPVEEGKNEINRKDPMGRPIGKMFLEAVSGPKGEGWVHYMWPEPGKLFPTWKSSFLKKVTYPSGKQYFIGSGIYNLQMNDAFIEDLVERAAKTVSEQGKKSFDKLRDKTGPYIFMETYVFVDTPEGVELVNAAQPSLEGKSLKDEKDLKGNLFVQEYLKAATPKGAWIEYTWYKPGEDKPGTKRVFVKKVQSGSETYILGAGYYPEEANKKEK